MGSAVERLTGLVDSGDRYDIPHTELLPLQLEAVRERFTDRVDAIRLLRNRADEAGITEARAADDIVPLLFAHTTYKSYPETWLIEGKWDRLGRWLDTVSTDRVESVGAIGVAGLDDWLRRLEQQGHYVSCSSGTTGKCAMMNASDADIAAAQRATVAGMSWALGMEPRRDRLIFGLAPIATTPRNLRVGDAVQAAFGVPEVEPFRYPAPPITIGSITEMVVLRKRMAEGVARPAEIAAYEAKTAERQRGIDEAIGLSAEALVTARHRKLHISGLLFSMYRIAEAVRAMGYSGKDFDPENTGQIGGGLKGQTLPSDHREFIFETFNLKPERVFHGYGMQELNTTAPKCRAGRYHLAPWVMLLMLDQQGERLLAPTGGEIEGRAGFFDLSLDGRWGGVISGDKVSASYEPCACGQRGPTIADKITRYADLPGGDKISCAGTIDAYVRGVA